VSLDATEIIELYETSEQLVFMEGKSPAGPAKAARPHAQLNPGTPR